MFRVGTTNEEVRVNWIESTLKKIPAGATLLDAGAGESQFKKFCSHLKYIAQDFGQYEGTGDVGLQTGSWDNSKLDIVSDIVSIPLPDASVDAIMCTEVFEHIPNPVLAIREFSRLLKPGGYLLITAPFASLTHFAPYHFASGLSRYFYEHHLPEHGFRIEELDLNGNYFEFIAQETRRVKQVGDKYAGVRLNVFQKTIQHLWLKILGDLSAKDKGSSELLCYGVHVFARRQG
ncbi:class I SAM-dependent methyltransferase [Flaviaesturariibacter amylovorans]|uniref:Methyltransferase type 11 domain-containing protein n=1 Tax=Flaviaesturariibacter amylovorans TaxID=1084520 RepID=A0ABP8H394_9BACT